MDYFRKKSCEYRKKDVPQYKIPNLNHTDNAYREAVDKLKVSLSIIVEASEILHKKLFQEINTLLVIK